MTRQLKFSGMELVYHRTCLIRVPSIPSKEPFVAGFHCCPIRAMSHSKLFHRMQSGWWEMRKKKKKKVTSVLP